MLGKDRKVGGHFAGLQVLNRKSASWTPISHRFDLLMKTITENRT